MRRIFGIAIGSVCMYLYVFAQINLVPNHGFEDYDKCPQGLPDFDGFIKYWRAANNGTPNYYNACSNSPDNGVPNTYFGYRPAHKGYGFVGIMTSNTFREFISVKLKSPLKADIKYKISLYSSINKNSLTCQSKGLDIVFTDSLTLSANASGNLVHKPSITFNPSYNGDQWVFSEMCYKAKGGEQSMVIGDFHYPVALHDCIGNGGSSYYFIDEVTVVENEDPIPIPLYLKYCNQPFPIELDAIKHTAITGDPASIIWEWDNVISKKTILINQNGIYKLRATFPDCLVKNYQVTIQNSDCKTKLYIPNVFTPNGDGKNDVLQVYLSGYSFNKISIFNRIGELVFSSVDKQFEWNGQSKNKNLPTGVYVYLVDYSNNITNERLNKTGTITLVR